jgi:hypothetical protein
MLVAEVERRLGLAGKLAAVIPDHRDPGAGPCTGSPTFYGRAS